MKEDAASHRTILVCREGEIPVGERMVINHDDEEILVFNLEGQYFAINSKCPHGGFRFTHGPLYGDGVVCLGHYWQFNVKTGACMEKDYEPARTYEVIKKNGFIYVIID